MATQQTNQPVTQPNKSIKTVGIIIASAAAVAGIAIVHSLVGDPADPREWFDWAFAHGMPGVLALINIVLSLAVIRLYRENAKLHHEKADVLISHTQALTHQALDARDREASKDAHCQEEIMGLEREMREEQRGLLKEQVKLSGVNARLIAENRSALDSIAMQLERNNKLLEYFIEQDLADADSAPPSQP